LPVSLRELLDQFPDLRPDRDAARCLERLEAERARAEATIALSLAHHAELDVDGLGGELRPFQRAGVQYALAQRRTFLADEQGLVCSASGDGEGCVEALRSSLEALLTYAPAILSLGSVEYQLDRRNDGRRLLLALLDLPVDTQDLAEIIDKAGDFLISIGATPTGWSCIAALQNGFRPRASCIRD
jgi:hypothetical protein